MLFKRSKKLILATVLCVFSVMLTLQVSFAEEIAATKTQEISGEAEINQGFDHALEAIERQKKIIKNLEHRAEAATGLSKKTYNARLIKARSRLLERGLSFANLVINDEPSMAGHEKYREQAIKILNSHMKVAKAAGNVLYEQISIPDDSHSAAEQAAVYSKTFATLDVINHTYEALIDSLDLLKQFDQDISVQEKKLKENFEERAANGSILIEIAMDDVMALQAGVTAVPDDLELKAKLSVAKNNVSNLAQALAVNLKMMNDMGIDTAEYQQQVLGATGEITAKVFDEGVISILYKQWSQKFWVLVSENGLNIVFKAVLFFGIIFVFRKMGNIAQKVVDRGFNKSKVQPSQLLRRMVISFSRNIITLIGVLIALSQIGISLGPLLAGLGVVGFVVGFALQDSLSNFAAGMMILIYRPFDVGDFIEACGIKGVVSHMSLANTTMLTFDNQKIIVPNNKIWGDVINNLTAQEIRRVDLTFGISYSDDIPKTEKVLREVAEAHEKVLKSPDIMIRVHELGDSSVNMILRPWVKTEDYWDVYWDLMRAVKMRFDEEGISIPFPQRDVHVHNV